MTKPMNPLFPYFGGKRRITKQVWAALGKPDIYIEPFAGSLAMLLGCPNPATQEIVNDFDSMLVNAWRALAYSTDETWKVATTQPSEVTLKSAHKLVEESKPRIVELVSSSPTAHDPEIAGWWIYRQSHSIGLQTARMSRPTNNGVSALQWRDADAPRRICERLRYVRIMQGDWKRCVTKIMFSQRSTGVFLDPPYGEGNVQYESDTTKDIWEEVWEWAKENGDDPKKRIVITGYDDRELPAGWSSSKGKGYGASWSSNTHREMVFYSPHCLREDKPTGFFE